MRKWEGITYDPDNMVMYTAMSEVAGGMENNMRQGSVDVNADMGGWPLAAMTALLQ
jgi:hypothetical protein